MEISNLSQIKVKLGIILEGPTEGTNVGEDEEDWLELMDEDVAEEIMWNQQFKTNKTKEPIYMRQ